jgi:hypothetical protein
MVKQDWTTSMVTQGKLHSLVSHGFMIAVELTASHMPVDPVSLVPAERYVVSFVAFYDWGFSVPSH